MEVLNDNYAQHLRLEEIMVMDLIVGESNHWDRAKIDGIFPARVAAQR